MTGRQARRFGARRAVEAALVLLLLVLLSPLLVILLAIKLARTMLGDPEAGREDRGRSTTWGLFVRA